MLLIHGLIFPFTLFASIQPIASTPETPSAMFLSRTNSPLHLGRVSSLISSIVMSFTFLHVPSVAGCFLTLGILTRVIGLPSRRGRLELTVRKPFQRLFVKLVAIDVLDAHRLYENDLDTYEWYLVFVKAFSEYSDVSISL
jgi:hypothetical protein